MTVINYEPFEKRLYRMPHLRILLLLAAVSLSLVAEAGHAQNMQRIGSFWFERRSDLITDEDRSFAGVEARTDGGHPLTLIFACFGDYLGIGFALTPGYSYSYSYSSADELRAVWRFDREEPEAVTLDRLSITDATFMIPEYYRHAFTARVRGASRLVVRVTNVSSNPTDHVFDLAGSGRALDGLACVRNLRPPDDPPDVLGRPADEVVSHPALPLETRADTVRLIEYATPENLRAQRGEVAVLAAVTADGLVSLERTRVTRTAHADFSAAAVFIVSQMSFPAGRARPVMVYVYFSPTGGHIQVEDPG
jgi:hypothetical protein